MWPGTSSSCSVSSYGFFIEQPAEVMFCVWQNYKQAAWFHVTKKENRKRNAEVETSEMDVQEFGMIIAGKH